MLECKLYWRDERLDILDKEFELVLVLRLGPGLTSTSPQPKIRIYSHKITSDVTKIKKIFVESKTFRSWGNAFK